MSTQLARQDHPVAEWLLSASTKEQMRAALPAHNLGNTEVAVKPGMVFISLIIILVPV